jgi:DNA-binding transcriptional MocR family regulator
MSDSALSIAFNPAGIELDPKKGLSRQLYHALRQRVLDGRLSGGARLPASRDLAAALGDFAQQRGAGLRSAVCRRLYRRAGRGWHLCGAIARKNLAAEKVVHQLVHRVFNRLTHSLIHKTPDLPVNYIQ